MTAFAEGDLGLQEALMVRAVAQSIRAGAAMLPAESGVRSALERWAGELSDAAQARLDRADDPLADRPLDLGERPELS